MKIGICLVGDFDFEEKKNRNFDCINIMYMKYVVLL